MLDEIIGLIFAFWIFDIGDAVFSNQFLGGAGPLLISPQLAKSFFVLSSVAFIILVPVIITRWENSLTNGRMVLVIDLVRNSFPVVLLFYANLLFLSLLYYLFPAAFDIHKIILFALLLPAWLVARFLILMQSSEDRRLVSRSKISKEDIRAMEERLTLSILSNQSAQLDAGSKKSKKFKKPKKTKKPKKPKKDK